MCKIPPRAAGLEKNPPEANHYVAERLVDLGLWHLKPHSDISLATKLENW